MRGTRNPRSLGFTLVEVMIVIGVIALIVAIALPGMIHARRRSRAKSCQENQIKLSWAVSQWALANNSSLVAPWSDLVGQGLFLNRTPRCPTTTLPIALPEDLELPSSCPTNEDDHEVSETH